MIDYTRYPPAWHSDIRPRILARADHQCECEGECGLHHDHRCTERNGTKATWAKGKIMLTIAHLDHDPENWDVKDDRLKAMCQRCHLRYDMPRHHAKQRANRLAKSRQLTMDLEPQRSREERRKR